jgi:CRISPR-associated exonuclease Cas4
MPSGWTFPICPKASPSLNPSDPDSSLPLSALQHWLFCPRQCALIHVERVWAENRFTAEGRILHERADAGRAESRDGLRILRAVQIASVRYGLHGVADVVEMRGAAPYPVEYKRGRPKAHRADEVQLCAQALCLEEMTGQTIPEGALFYGTARRRKVVPLDTDLRTLTLMVAQEARDAIEAGNLPAPVFDARRCNTCSMHDLCRPTGRRDLGLSWMTDRITRAGAPE